jgi:dipeptidase E
MKQKRMQRAIDEAEAIFVGGGNTFRLLKGLYDCDLIAPIRERVAAGTLYIGSSAGSIVACPTLKTTKDMPVVQPPSFAALRLVPFQISPHYLDPDPSSTHMGETQEERITQFLEENTETVVGLREGSLLRVQDGVATLKGQNTARIFRRDEEPVEVAAGSGITELLLGGAGATAS